MLLDIFAIFIKWIEFQLAHLKHFLTNPLTALASLVPHLPSGINALSLEPTLQEPGSTEFKELLVQRLTSDRNDADNSNSTSSLTALTRAVHVAWSQFRTRTRSIRLAYLLLQGLHDFLSEKGYKGLGNHWGSTTVPAFMSTAAQTAASTSSSRYPQYLRLQNYINLLQLHAQTHSKQSAKDITYARTLLRKLRPEELRAYLNTLIPKLQELQNELGVDIPTGGDEGEERSNLNLAEVVRMLEEWRSEAEEVYRAYETVETGTRERNMNQAAVEKFKLLNENLAEWMYEYLGYALVIILLHRLIVLIAVPLRLRLKVFPCGMSVTLVLQCFLLRWFLYVFLRYRCRCF